VLSTILVTDIVASTRQAAALGDRAWRQLLAEHDAITRRHLEQFRGREVKHTGDGFLAFFDGPARSVRCAAAITEELRRIDLPVRAGIHTGEVEISDDRVGGLAIHVATHIAAEAAPGEVLVSGTVRDLVAGSGLRFRERGRKVIADGEAVPLFAAERDAADPGARAGGGRPGARLIEAGPDQLTEREREVLRLIAQGLSNPVIAQTLGLSEHTVKRHVANILTKLDLPSRAAAAALAARHRIA
jgi:class 3 adenylate cyclase